MDYSSHWLKKLEEKRGDGTKRERKEPAKKSQPIEEEGNNNISLRMEEELESDKTGPSLQISKPLF